MKLGDFIYITLQNFVNRKLRVFFTVLGVAVAIAVVLSLVSFGYGLEKNLLSKITTEQSLSSLDIYPSDSDVIKIDDATISKILGLDNVDSVSPEASFSGQVSYNKITSEAAINVIGSDFFMLDGRKPLAGTFFTSTGAKQVVVSSVVPELFNMTNEEILGKHMSYTVFYPKNEKDSELSQLPFGEDFEVVGVTEGRGSSGELFFNKKDFPADIPVFGYQFAKIKVKDTDQITEVKNNLTSMGFFVSAISDIVDQANKIFRVVRITLGVFGTFALAVAAIGLVNTMTISLLERTNEIGIMRAIGASPREIRWIFLSESTIIGLLGGVSGILIGIIGSEILNWGFSILAHSLGGSAVRLFSYPVWFIFSITIISTCVGLLGGIWPASRAAKMHPLQALRYK